MPSNSTPRNSTLDIPSTAVTPSTSQTPVPTSIPTSTPNNTTITSATINLSPPKTPIDPPNTPIDIPTLLQTYLPPSLAASWDPDLPVGLNISTLLGRDTRWGLGLGLQGLCVYGCVCRRGGVAPGIGGSRDSDHGMYEEEEIRKMVDGIFSALRGAAKQAKKSGRGSGCEVQKSGGELELDDMKKSRACW